MLEEVSHSSTKWATICKGNPHLLLCLCVLVSVLYLVHHTVL